MFRKYEKTYRANLPGFTALHKNSISDKELKELLSGKVVIEEKMDGANTGIIRPKEGFRLQKRGSLVDTSEHEQYNRFKAWAYENYDKIMRIPLHTLVYGEFLFAQHCIYYDRLPDWFLVFDVFNMRKKIWYSYQDRVDLCRSTGLSMVPFLGSGHYTKEDLIKMVPKVSKYGDRAEGMVIKRYSKGNYLRAKIVWPDFIKEVDESDHWTKYNIRTNKLADK